MTGILIGLFVIVCVALVVVILMQSGRGGGGLSSSFGGSFMSGAVFGGKGATEFLSKLTIGLGIAFVVLIIMINFSQRHSSPSMKSVVKERAGQVAPVSAPAGGAVPMEQPAANPAQGE